MKITNILYKKLFFWSMGNKEFTVVDFQGAKFKASTRDFTILPSMLNGNYENKLIAIFQALARPGDTIIDVGANIGIYSIIGSKVVGDKGRIYAFEPEPGNYNLLKHNLQLNSCSNVKPIQKAVGEKKGKLSLFLAKNSTGTHSLINKSNHEVEGEIEVDVVSLDKELSKVDKISILKVDVEGYEPIVFRGAKSILKKTKILFFEYNKTDVNNCSSIDELAGMLKGFKYLYGLDEKAGRLDPFTMDDLKKKSYINIIASKRALPDSIQSL